MAHWNRILEDKSVVKKTILLQGEVAGSVVSFVHAGEREVGYWTGREFWGRDVATRALAEFLRLEARRPLYADVARHNAASIRVLENCGFRVSAENPGDLTFKLVADETDRGRAAERSTGVKIEREGLFVGPDEGKSLPNPIGGRMVVKVRDGDTGGSFSRFTTTSSRPGLPVPPLPRPRGDLLRPRRGTDGTGRRTQDHGPRRLVRRDTARRRPPALEPGDGAGEGAADLLPLRDGALLRRGGRGTHPPAGSTSRPRRSRKTRRLRREIRLRVRGVGAVRERPR